MKTLGKVVSFFVALLALALVQGWVLTVLWGWFVVPTFGVAHLPIAYALGLSATANLFVGAKPSTKDQSLSDIFVSSFTYTFVALALGFLWSLFR